LPEARSQDMGNFRPLILHETFKNGTFYIILILTVENGGYRGKRENKLASHSERLKVGAYSR